jgi:hypothetical protein
VAPGSCSTRTPRTVLTSEPDDEDAFYGDLMSSSFGGEVEMILPIEDSMHGPNKLPALCRLIIWALIVTLAVSSSFSRRPYLSDGPTFKAQSGGPKLRERGGISCAPSAELPVTFSEG